MEEKKKEAKNQLEKKKQEIIKMQEEKSGSCWERTALRTSLNPLNQSSQKEGKRTKRN